jgi:hypothetical protein
MNKLSKEVYDEMKKTISMFAASGCSDEKLIQEPDGGEDAKAEKKDKRSAYWTLKTVEPRTRF